MGGLAAIAAVLGTATGFDGEEAADLDGVGVEILPVNCLCPEQQIIERRIIDNLRLFGGATAGIQG
jgi:hypothetical protein